MPNTKNLIPYKKGQSGNPNGRPRKFVSKLTSMGYSKREVVDTIENLLSMTLDELKDVYTNDKATILEKIIASALKRSIEKGEISTIETLLTRVYGKAEQKVEVSGNNPIQIIMPPPIPDEPV